MTDVFNDIFLKRYVTALFKKQWGANLSKFNGVTMIGGVTLNGQQIYQEALQDVQKLEEDIKRHLRNTCILHDRIGKWQLITTFKVAMGSVIRLKKIYTKT